jgi:deoxyadenosine/deoxycytidine kinase
MLDTQLIVIDGLPGSGKTTSIKWLAQQLEQCHIHADYLFEFDTAHPLWWYEYWDGTDYRTPDFDNIPIETFIQNSLGNWRGFADSLQESDQLIVAESIFFQNATTMLLMGDADQNRLKKYAHEVQQLVRQLNPVLIYFHQIDPANSLRRTCAIRGPEFEQELLTNMESFPYLKSRNLKGLDGLSQLWLQSQQITDQLFEEYTIRKVAIENSTGNWTDYYQRILDFLQLES